MNSLPDNGLVNLRSSYSVQETITRVETVLQASSLNIFVCVDHSGEAEKVGLKLRPTQLIIFGSPRAGTPLMVASPTLAIDLPLKALVWEDDGGQVWLTFNSPEYLQKRHNVPTELVKNISGVSALFQKAIE